MKIGFKLYKKDKNLNNYRNIAIWCNNNNAHIEDKDEYYEIVENKEYQLTLEEKILLLEQNYQMNRWQREIILAKNSGASKYIKDRAKEIEKLAEQLRNE